MKENITAIIESTYKLCKFTGRFSSLGVIPWKNYSPFYNLPPRENALVTIRERIAVNIAIYLTLNYLLSNLILHKLYASPIKPKSLSGLISFAIVMLLLELWILPRSLENSAKLELQEEKGVLEPDSNSIKIRAQQNAHVIMASFRSMLYFFIPTLLGAGITAWYMLERYAQYEISTEADRPDIQLLTVLPSSNLNAVSFSNPKEQNFTTL